MKFTAYILIAFVFAIAAALPQDGSEHQHLSPETEMPRFNSEIEEILKKTCGNCELICEESDPCLSHYYYCDLFCKVCRNIVSF